MLTVLNIGSWLLKLNIIGLDVFYIVKRFVFQTRSVLYPYSVRTKRGIQRIWFTWVSHFVTYTSS